MELLAGLGAEMLNNQLLEAPWNYFWDEGADNVQKACFKNHFLETPWNYFWSSSLEIIESHLSDAPWSYFRTWGLEMSQNVSWKLPGAISGLGV